MDSNPKSPVSTPSAEDQTEKNEVAALSSQLPTEGRTDSPTPTQMQKTSHIRYDFITTMLIFFRYTHILYWCKFSSLYKDIVYVDVGPSKQRFSVHKGLICHKSKFFSAAFNSSFSEAVNGIVELVEEEPEIFDIAHAWLYTNELTWSEGGKDVPCLVRQLSDLFVLADKLDMPLLCNKAIDGLKSKFLETEYMPSVTLINTAYTKTPESSPLRKLYVAVMTFDDRQWLVRATKHREGFLKYPEFLIDIAGALQKQITRRPTSLANAPFLKDCSFHQHAEGEKDCSGKVVPPTSNDQAN